MWEKPLLDFIEDNPDLMETYPESASEIINKMWEKSTMFSDCANAVRKLMICLHYIKFGNKGFIMKCRSSVSSISLVLCNTLNAMDFYEITAGVRRDPEDGPGPLIETDLRNRLYAGLTSKFMDVPENIARSLAYFGKIDPEVLKVMVRYRRVK